MISREFFIKSFISKSISFESAISIRAKKAFGFFKIEFVGLSKLFNYFTYTSTIMNLIVFNQNC